MSEVKGLRVLVAGAGAIGSVTALILARRGARVTLADPAEVADNASGVAAGMLAPVAEALLDPVSHAHLPLLLQARDAWDRLLPDLAAFLDRSGTVIEASAGLLDRARTIGAKLEPLAAAEARRRCPGLAPDGPFLFTPEDWRLEPRMMLAALHGALAGLGGQLLRSEVANFTGGRAQLRDRELPADILIRATGHGAGLTPIKGQILRFPGAGPARGVVARGEGVYVAPSEEGAVAGATMEEGRADREIDPQAIERLRTRAVRLFPALAQAEVRPFAGVRAATADGLPLVGLSEQKDVLVARGARRNGWLLAPLVAEVLVDALEGRPRSAAARAFEPNRFS